MDNIYEIRDYIEGFVSRFEIWIKAAFRFILAMITLSVVNGRLGYMEKLDSSTIVVAVSLLCALMPSGMIVFFAAIFVVLHAYALSLEVAIIVLALFLLMFLLYFRFTPNDTLAVILTPLSFLVGIPHTMPLIYGLCGSPFSALSVGFGAISYFTVDYVSDSADKIKGMTDATTVERFRTILDGMIKNRTMMAYVIAFAATVVLVSIIRRLPIKHAWSIAIGLGAATEIIMLMILSVRLNADINIPPLFVGTIIATAIAFLYKLFVFSVDYARTERVQFEDDSYVYYVKAVPKIKTSVKRRMAKDRKEKKEQEEDY
jgi:predicted membrane metal-binding protein